MALPEELEIIEGGTAGLNLFPLLERPGRLVLADAVSGFTNDGSIIILERSDIIQSLTTPQFGHDVGLPYLLTMFPEVCNGVMPEEIIVIGLEGVCDTETVEKAAKLSVSIAINGV
jgi:hydrogenase maturation protease